MRIQGLGVIDDATLELDAGLTVLTGETGAGKTMVVTGLTLLGGGRAEASRVADGARRAVVEGRFTADAAALAVADEVGAEADDDGALIAVRTVGADGRSRAHLGGRAVPVGVLARLADSALAVHGQNDQLRLLRPAEQRALLDRFAGDAVGVPLQRYRAVRAEWQAVAAELVERRDGARRLAQEADLLRHGLTEIEAVDPQPGEDRELTEEARRLAAADDLREAAGTARTAIAGGDAMDDTAPAAVALVGEARHRLAASGDGALAALDAVLGDVLAQLDDVAGELTIYLDRLDADPERLGPRARPPGGAEGAHPQVRRRHRRRPRVGAAGPGAVGAPRHLGRRAGGARRAPRRTGRGARRRTLRRSPARAPLRRSGWPTAPPPSWPGWPWRTRDCSSPSHPVRRARVLPTHCTVGDTSLAAGADGVDEVELRLVAHPGATPQPVHKGASGGELSRVMLALEVALAGADPVPTMVFDEVDAGVGGRAAVEIGRRLARLAVRHQVVVVTHLPQVAAYADRHLLVDKARAGDGPARSRVRTLDEGERVGELARMLAGLDETDTGRAHAEELLAAARAHRDADRVADGAGADDGAAGGRAGRRSRRGTAPVPA